MSTLQVNTLQPYSGDTLILSGSTVLISGSLTVNTSITSSGDLRFPNMGTGVVNPVTDVSASGTSSLSPIGISTTTSTTFLNYGINVINYSDADNYCVKLPSTPTKGKEVTLVNLSGLPVYVFPGVEGGSVNSVVGNDITIPSDGIAYKFVCWENPLPGGWSLVSAGASTVIQSDVIGGLLITQSAFSTSTFYQVNAFVSNTLYDLGGQTTFSAAEFANGSYLLNGNLHGAGHYGTGPTSPYAFFTPEPNIRKINNITILTNLSSSGESSSPDPINFVVVYHGNIGFFKTGTTTEANYFDYEDPTYVNWFNNTSGVPEFFNDLALDDLSFPGGYGYASMGPFYSTYNGNSSIIDYIPGTFTPADPNYVPTSTFDWTGYLSTNPGDPGTTYYYTDRSNSDNSSSSWGNSFGKGVGMFNIATTPPGITDADGDQIDIWYFSNFGFRFLLDRRAYIDGLKLKVIIDYVPYP
jgi:hypothetical protein